LSYILRQDVGSWDGPAVLLPGPQTKLAKSAKGKENGQALA